MPKTNRLSQWVHTQQRIADSAFSLRSAIFGSSIVHYLLYRSRYSVFYTLLRAALHIIESFVFFHAFPALFFPLALARIVSLAISSSWWGVTDPMRHRIRMLRSRQD